MRLEYLTYWLLCATVSWALTQDISKFHITLKFTVVLIEIKIPQSNSCRNASTQILNVF